MRFIKVFGLVAVLAGVFAAVAVAGGYTDASYNTPIGYVGKPYSHTVAWKPGNGCPPYKYSFSSGAFPPGLTISSSGAITGTPTQAGTFTFYIQMQDLCGVEGQGNSPFTINIRPGLTVTAPALLPIAITGAAYSYTFTANGSGPLTWTVNSGQLPAGFTLGANGVLSGTPTAVGSSTFVVQASNGDLTDTKQVTVQVFAPLVAKSQVLKGAEVGVSFADKLTATGGNTASPYQWSATGLPDGLALDAAQGVISGTPTTIGNFTATVTVTDASGLTNQIQVAIPVKAKLAIASAALRSARAGAAYHGAIKVSGGFTPVRFLVISGKLPAGIHLNARTGALTGRASSAGTFHFRVRAHDALGVIATRAFVLSVH